VSFSAATEGIDSSGKYWKYQGELFHGLPQGNGKITWEDGDSYEGEFLLVIE
jgi:hypothetical protein